jgi:hypothetical protein
MMTAILFCALSQYQAPMRATLILDALPDSRCDVLADRVAMLEGRLAARGGLAGGFRRLCRTGMHAPQAAAPAATRLLRLVLRPPPAPVSLRRARLSAARIQFGREEGCSGGPALRLRRAGPDEHRAAASSGSGSRATGGVEFLSMTSARLHEARSPRPSPKRSGPCSRRTSTSRRSGTWGMSWTR